MNKTRVNNRFKMIEDGHTEEATVKYLGCTRDDPNTSHIIVAKLWHRKSEPPVLYVQAFAVGTGPVKFPICLLSIDANDPADRAMQIPLDEDDENHWVTKLCEYIPHAKEAFAK